MKGRGNIDKYNSISTDYPVVLATQLYNYQLANCMCYSDRHIASSLESADTPTVGCTVHFNPFSQEYE